MEVAMSDEWRRAREALAEFEALVAERSVELPAGRLEWAVAEVRETRAAIEMAARRHRLEELRALVRDVGGPSWLRWGAVRELEALEREMPGCAGAAS